MFRFLHEILIKSKTISKQYLFSCSMFRQLRICFFLLIVCITKFSHAQFEEEGTQGDIRGFVYSAENGDRSGAATVAVFGMVNSELLLSGITQTDNDGFFAITSLDPGTYQVVCYKGGFDTLIKKVDVKS